MAQVGKSSSHAGSDAGAQPGGGSTDPCGAPTKAGRPCPAPATWPDGQCNAHSAHVSDDTRKIWRQRGRLAQQKSAAPAFTSADFRTEDSVRKILEETTDLVRAGKLPVNAASAVSKLASVGLKAAELGVARRLAEIEKQLREHGDVPKKRRR